MLPTSANISSNLSLGWYGSSVGIPEKAPGFQHNEAELNIIGLWAVLIDSTVHNSPKLVGSLLLPGFSTDIIFVKQNNRGLCILDLYHRLRNFRWLNFFTT